MSEERVRYNGKLVGLPSPHELWELAPRIRAVLAAVEWADGSRCLICRARDRHAANCELAALREAIG